MAVTVHFAEDGKKREMLLDILEVAEVRQCYLATDIFLCSLSLCDLFTDALFSRILVPI